jgi:hypothetical protein
LPSLSILGRGFPPYVDELVPVAATGARIIDMRF